MSESAAAALAVPAWPPHGLALAPRLFAERRDSRETAFDRWVAGLWLARSGRRSAHLRRRAALLARVLAQSALVGGQTAAQLRAALPAAARAAFVDRDPKALALALAIVREAARQTLGLLPHPAQLIAAAYLVEGRCVEFDTGEGKTLTAALAACIAACAGVPTHVVTVNDYLAQRDATTMGPLFAFFGLCVGIVHSGVAQAKRAAEYACHLTYCTNKDLVFDYLRDRVGSRGLRSNAQRSVQQLHTGNRHDEGLRQRGLHFAIIDEADSILIDEARTPLILSALHDNGAAQAAWGAMLEVAGRLDADRHFKLQGEAQVPELLPAGRRWLETFAAGEAEGGAPDIALNELLDEFRRVEWVREHYIVQALRALHVLRRDQHYVVSEGKIVIVDEFTGRLLADRSWEQGLHQLVEAKEGVAITAQNRTLARLTYQAFFARYLRLSGMSGTLREVARELGSVYLVRTTRVEPNRPCQRITLPTLLLPDRTAKEAAIVVDVRAALARGQAVLVGTRSVWASQAIGSALAADGVAHRLLNALHDADEAELIATAGQPGAVTVATNMAGRGTDIVLAPEVAAAGGLHVVLSEWHESARIDRQLFGRGARQGDAGSCRAIVALDDEIVQLHASALAGMLARRWPGQPPAWATTALRRLVQAGAESNNAAQRRATMRHDRVMRDQLAFAGLPE